MIDVADETLRDIARMVGSNPSDADQQRGLRLAAIRELSRVQAERDSAIRLAADQARIMGDLRAQIATLTSQCIEIMTGRRSTVSAEAAADAILARAGEDGALHRDAMIEVLRKVGGLA